MNYTGQERRKHPRIGARFVVSYRILDEADNVDVSQTKNLSLGGMLLTTNKKFRVGTHLTLEIRLPFDPDPIMTIAKVLESREISKDLIYDTRLNFLAINGRHKSIMKDTIDFYLKKG